MPCEPSVLELPVAQSAALVNTAGWEIVRPAARSRGEPAADAGSAPRPAQSGAVSAGVKPTGDETFIIALPRIVDGMNIISRFPHTRKGLPPRQIGDEEIESHLSEVEAARGVRPDNANLVAVFRTVPAELISRVRFDESRRLLLFRLVSCEGKHLTRVYDMAAVKDRSTGRLHLVPHRTRNRTVLLS